MDEVQVRAERGKYRLVSEDSLVNQNFVLGDYATPGEAVTIAVEKTHRQKKLRMHIYDDAGRHIFSCGAL